MQNAIVFLVFIEKKMTQHLSQSEIELLGNILKKYFKIQIIEFEDSF